MSFVECGIVLAPDAHMASGKLPIPAELKREGIPQVPEETLAKIRHAFRNGDLPWIWLYDSRVSSTPTPLLQEVNPARAKNGLPPLSQHWVADAYRDVATIQELVVYKKFRTYKGKDPDNACYRVLLPDVPQVYRALLTYNPFRSPDDASKYANKLAQTIGVQRQESQPLPEVLTAYVLDKAMKYFSIKAKFGKVPTIEVENLTDRVAEKVQLQVRGFSGDFETRELFDHFISVSCKTTMVDWQRKQRSKNPQQVPLFEDEPDRQRTVEEQIELSGEENELSWVGLIDQALAKEWITREQWEAMDIYFSDKTIEEIRSTLSHGKAKLLTWQAVKARVLRGRHAILRGLSGEKPQDILSNIDAKELSADEQRVLELLQAGKMPAEIVNEWGSSPSVSRIFIATLRSKFLYRALKLQMGLPPRLQHRYYRTRQSLVGTTAQVWAKLATLVEAKNPDAAASAES